MMEDHVFFNDKGRYRIKFTPYDKLYRENIEVLEGSPVPEDLTSFYESLKDEETGKYWAARLLERQQNSQKKLQMKSVTGRFIRGVEVMDRFKETLTDKLKDYDAEVFFSDETKTFVRYSVNYKDKEISKGSFVFSDKLMEKTKDKIDVIFSSYIEAALESVKSVTGKA